MTAPKINIKETDLSTRVPSFPGVYSGIVISAPKGEVNVPRYITSDTELLRYFTPDERVEVGYSLGFYSALAYLSKANRLWVVRADNGSKYGGVLIKKDGNTNIQLTDVAIADITGVNQGTKTFTVDGDVTSHVRVDDIIRMEDSTGNDGLYTIVSATEDTINRNLPIIGVNQLDKEFTADGDYVYLIEGDEITISGSTGNDGTYTIASLTLSGGDTIIEVEEVIPDATIDGNISADIKVTNIVVDETISSAVVDGEIYKNSIVTPENYEFASNDLLLITGANQGAWADDIEIELFTYANNPDIVKEPGVGGEAFMIKVYKASTGDLLETHICSRNQNAKDGYGKNIYVEDVISSSNYIKVIDNVAEDATEELQEYVVDGTIITSPLNIDGSLDGEAVADTHMMAALNTLRNTNDLALTIVMDGGWATTAYQKAIDDLCQFRKDCVGVLSTPYSLENTSSYITDLVGYRKNTLNLNSSYSSLYTPHVKISDRFNDRQIFIAPDGYAAGAISETAANAEIWYAPAGYRRGVINVIDVNKRFTSGELDLLYDNGINPIKFSPGKGIAIWGQKTLLSRPSALDRLNVRLLLITIEPAIAAFLEDFLFEFNDEFTRLLVKSGIDSYMDDIKARRGVYAYSTVCDETNNTPADIDNNVMNVWLFVQPTKVAEFITLNVAITRTGFDFNLAQGLLG